MPLLFSYGSLQEPPVQLATFGRHVAGARDALAGHTLATVVMNGRACANAVPGDAAALVRGTAFAVTEAELALTDEYEAADRYARHEVTLQSGRRAWIYTFSGQPAPVMRVRPAREDDLVALTRIWSDGWHDAHDGIVPPALVALRTHASFGERLRAELHAVRVVVDAGTPAGFAMLRDAEVFQFYVARSARGTGAAQRLMRDTEARMAANGIATAWLACAVGNTRAARFYEKCGWSRTRTEVIESETSSGRFPIDVWRYEKRLL